MTKPVALGVSLLLVALLATAGVLWIGYGDDIFVEHMLATLAGCF
ncbi:hypothetical protein [Amorphus sp. 3PC139-8]